MSPTALFCWPTVHSSREMRPVADFLSRQGWTIVVRLSWRDANSADVVASCRTAGFDVAEIDARHCGHVAPESVVGDAADDVALTLSADAAAEPQRGLLRRAAATVRFAILLARRRRYARQVVERTAPDVVFMEQFHGWGLFDNGVVRAARRRGSLLCCIPMSPYSGEANAIGGRFDNLAAGMVGRSIRLDYDLFNRLVGWARPGWTREQDGVRLFMMDPVQMIAARVVGLHTPDSWQKPTPEFDVVFLESDFARSMLDERSYPMTDLVIVGKPYLDAVFASLEAPDSIEEFVAELGPIVNEPFLLWNVEPSAEHKYSSWGDHWRRTTAVADALADSGRPVVVSLHPLCAPADYSFLESRYRFVISRRLRIHDLYPRSAACVSFPCSTNQLAGLFGTPLVIYDFFGVTSENRRRDLFRIEHATYAYSAEELRTRLAELPPAGQRVEAPTRPTCVQIAEVVRDRLEGCREAKVSR